MKYVLISSEGAVVNIVVWDGIALWSPPKNTQLVEIGDNDLVDIGWLYENGEFIPNPVSEEGINGQN